VIGVGNRIPPSSSPHWNPVGEESQLPRNLKQGFYTPPTAAVFSQATSASFTPWEAPPPSPSVFIDCHINLAHVTGPSGHLSCLAHVCQDTLEVEPTLVGRIFKVVLVCTNLPRALRKGLLDTRGTGAQITLLSTSTHARNQVACPFGRLVLCGRSPGYLRDDAR